MIRHLLLNSVLTTFRIRISQETTRNYVRRSKEPGINNRLKLFSEDFVENDPETFEALEPDFMNVQDAHKQYEQEQQQQRQNVASRIVGRKYFNAKNFNFLTWSEKEQIRSLNKKDPVEWSADKLSESFPADPYAISRIIRNYWQPRDEKRIQKHDESVRRTWANFKAGEIEVEPFLANHLKKFAHRNFDEVAKPKVNRKLGIAIPKPESNEFSSIITSCKKYAEKKEDKLELSQLESNEYEFPKLSKDSENDSVVLKGKIKNTMKWMPLSEYQKLSPDIIQKDKDTNAKLVETSVDIKAVKKHEEPGVVSLKVNDKIVFKELEIKDEIRVPKGLWKKGQTYKVKDCFYDDDGEFLYRVPGLK